MQMNEMISFITSNNDTFTSFTEIPMSEGQFQRKMFREFLRGNAGYVCRTLKEFRDLFIMLRHTNISMFNANYVFPDEVPKFSTKGIKEFLSVLPDAFSKINPFVPMGNWDGVLLWLLPQETDGSYDVSPAFIKSVNEVLGYRSLHSIKRMEYLPVTGYHNCNKLNVTSIPWAVRSISAEDLTLGKYALVGLKDPDGKSGIIRPIFDCLEHEDKARKLFYIVNPKFDRIGSSYLADMIELQLKYRKTMNNSIRRLMTFVLNTMPDILIDDKRTDTDTLMKAQAVIAWLLSPRTNNVHLYFKNGVDTFKKLTSIAMFCNVVIPPINAACVGVFMDMQGMIQVEETRGENLSGYRVIDDCDDAISLIHRVIDLTTIMPCYNGPSFDNACHYPYFDNVPSIFWNGGLF